MSLIIPSGPSWAHCTDNLSTVTALTAPGTALTPGASHVKGSAVQIFSALAHDVEYLRIAAQGFYTNGQNSAALMDVLYDPAGGTDWQVLIPDLCVGFTGTTLIVNPPSCLPVWYDFPIWIPAGSTVAVRAQCAQSSPPTGYVAMIGYGGNRNPASWWCGQRVVANGANEAASQGALVTPAAGSWGSWTNIGSATAQTCGALQLAIHGQWDASFQTSAGFHLWQFSADDQQIGPTFLKQMTDYENGITIPKGGLHFASLPAGTQFKARGMLTPPNLTFAFDLMVYTVH